MSHSHGASSFENINRQGPSSVQSITADTSSQVALEINLETSVHAAQENQNQTYERARRFHKMSHPQSASVGEEIDRQACTDQCLVRSVSIPPYSPNFLRGDSTNHAALDFASLERLSPIREENPDHNQRQRDCLTLYRAALKGNWREAEDIIRRYPDDIIRASITEMGDTVLHIASATKHATFVKKVVGLLTGKEELAQKNKCGDTAFCIAAESGIVTNAEEMWKKNEDLVLIQNKKERTPLQAAALFGHRDMVAYLLPKTSFKNLTTKEKMDILVATITHDMYDITFEILGKESTLATANNRALALRELARKPSAIGSRSQPSLWKSCLNSYITFKILEKEATLATANNRVLVLWELARKTSGIGSESQPSVWKRCLNSWFKRIFNKALMETLAHQLVIELSEEVQLFKDKKLDVLSLLTIAAKVGNAEFLIILIRTYPDIMWITDSRNRSLFHIAVINRQESVFNLIHEVVTFKEIILTKYDKPENENILHLAGYMAPPSRLNIVSGAALQMQRELLWFKLQNCRR